MSESADTTAGSTAATSSAFSSVCDNFKQEQEFGWFISDSSVTRDFPQKLDHGDLKYKQAAVMFLLACINGSLHIMMTKRSNTIRTHKGLYDINILLCHINVEFTNFICCLPAGDDCLPGGAREPSETSPVETALREAQEETGLDPNLVTIVTVAPPFIAGRDILMVVSPVVCILNVDPKALRLTPCENEVDCVYWMPIRNFLENDQGMEYVKFRYHLFDQFFSDKKAGFHFDSIETGQHHFVWGLTASICVTLSSIALNRAPAYPYSENIAISSIWTEDKRLKVTLHEIALTSEHREKNSPNEVNSNMCIDKWANRNISKL